MTYRFRRGVASAAEGGADSIRSALVEDSAFLGEAILHASRSHLDRGLWDLAFEGDEDARLGFTELLSLIDGPSPCHFSNFLIAEIGGEPAATLSGFDPGGAGMVTTGHLIAQAYAVIGATEGEAAEAFRRLGSYQPGVPEQKLGVWTVEWVWTAPAMRRRGLQAALLDHLFAVGVERGYRRAQVTTFIGNTGAIRAYEAAGFKLAEEKRDPGFQRLMGAPGLARFERAL